MFYVNLVINVFGSITGRSHDAHVFNKSDLNQTLSQKCRIGGLATQNTYHILGDSTFPCLQQMITPYKRYQSLTRLEKKFNKHLSSK